MAMEIKEWCHDHEGPWGEEEFCNKCTNPDGTPRPSKLNSAPLSDLFGALIETRVIAGDVTDKMIHRVYQIALTVEELDKLHWWEFKKRRAIMWRIRNQFVSV